MSMAHSQFMRIVTLVGGDLCSERRFIRACHTLLKQEAKGRGCRVPRHEWIRGGLCLLWDNRELLKDHSISSGGMSRYSAALIDYEDWVTESLCEQLSLTHSDAQGIVMLYKEALPQGFAQGVDITHMASLIGSGSVPMIEPDRGGCTTTSG